MDLHLRGRRAFVAAASKGIGRAIALELAAEGCDVGICARGQEALERVADEARAKGVRAHVQTADVADHAQVTAAVAGTVMALGGLDILIVNAGGPPLGTFADADDAAWHAAADLTLMSAVRLIRNALPSLQASDAGSIVIVSSVAAREPIDGLMLSNALRSAVSGMAKTLARELAPRVRVNTVLPGRIRTDRILAMAGGQGAGDENAVNEALAAMGKAIPMGRIGEPEEFAHAAVFLASPAASYITGASLPVDGGSLRAAH